MINLVVKYGREINILIVMDKFSNMMKCDLTIEKLVSKICHYFF